MHLARTGIEVEEWLGVSRREDHHFARICDCSAAVLFVL
jgi:hypothetical protein